MHVDDFKKMEKTAQKDVDVKGNWEEVEVYQDNEFENGVWEVNRRLGTYRRAFKDGTFSDWEEYSVD